MSLARMASCDLQFHLQFIVQMSGGQFFRSPRPVTLTGFCVVGVPFCRTRTVRCASFRANGPRYSPTPPRSNLWVRSPSDGNRRRITNDWSGLSGRCRSCRRIRLDGVFVVNRQRKVRASQDRVMGNSHRPRGQGQCNRKQTADRGNAVFPRR